jgi:hypothetical protein
MKCPRCERQTWLSPPVQHAVCSCGWTNDTGPEMRRALLEMILGDLKRMADAGDLSSMKNKLSGYMERLDHLSSGNQLSIETINETEAKLWRPS